MLAGCLHRMGVEMEDQESHPETDGIHPKGMWERKQFEIMNDKILERAGGDWQNPPPEKNIKGLLDNTKLADEIRHLIRKTQKPLWGWKDPRNALTIPVWHPHLVNPYYIMLRRNIESIVKSYMCEQYRWKFGKDFKASTQAEIHIYDYYNRILNFVKDKDNVLKYIYEDILEHPLGELRELRSFIEDAKLTPEVLEMVDPSLRHF